MSYFRRDVLPFTFYSEAVSEKRTRNAMGFVSWRTSGSSRLTERVHLALSGESHLLQSPSMRPAFVACLACAALSAAALDQKDVEYDKVNGLSLLLDLHVPDGAGPFPAAILVHGGGFDEGSKSTNPRPLMQPLADAGFAWFSIDYRLAPAAHLPEAFADVQNAIRFVKTYAERYHVDPAKIVLIGESAGGFLVNYTGTHLTPDTRVAAIVDLYGPVDYEKLALERRDHPERFNMTSINRHASNGGGIRFFGADSLDDAGRAMLSAISPIHRVAKGMPPFLCIHGTKDDQVSFNQSPAMCDAMKKAGNACELITVEGGGHGMSSWKAPEQQHWKPEMISWLKKTLKLD
jgi:alpha-L-fucosidase 2